MVGYPHDLKGQGIYCYVTLMADETWSDALQGAARLGAQGDRPDRPAGSHSVRAGTAQDALGQDHARILRKIAEDDFGNLGDTSTLADPSVVTDLIEHRQNRKSA